MLKLTNNYKLKQQGVPLCLSNLAKICENYELSEWLCISPTPKKEAKWK